MPGQQPDMPGLQPDDLAARELAWSTYPNDARDIDPQASRSVCSSSLCALPVWRGYTAKNGKPNAFDIKPDGTFTGTSHWRTCRDRATFQKR